MTNTIHINQPKLQKSKFPSAVSGEEKKADYGIGKGRFFNARCSGQIARTSINTETLESTTQSAKLLWPQGLQCLECLRFEHATS